MPLNLAKSDRRLLLWAALVILPIIVALAFLTKNDAESSIPSSYSASPGGAKGAFLLLQELGYRAERWREPPAGLPSDAGSTVLVMAQPTAVPESEDRKALESYVARGGKVLITGPIAELFIPQADIEIEILPDPVGRKYEPRLLTSITRGGAIEMSPLAYWKKPSTQILSHYEDGERPVVVSYRFGKGEVIWWAGSGPLSNAGIVRPGNLVLLLNSIGAPAGMRVLWDEYFHGSRQSLGNYVWQTPLKYATYQCLAIFLAVLVTYSRRHGPIHPAHGASRLSPLEFVQTLGNLYRRAKAAGEGLAVPYARFRGLVTRRLGLPGDVPAPALAQAILDHFHYKDKSLGPLLARIEAGLGRSDLEENQALAMVQQLNIHMRNLKLVSQDQQENISHADRLPGASARTN
ncbi:MAG TPA: DUF4350 domain-containing protein [Candidatus Saccharimonadales bacterium]|jgi:hypothetical protein|nr:DUF4350 domain-containing protein [Candidatus Saccharimonadales bacterium]